MPDIELYLTAYYFTVTTVTTVGFGDITAEHWLEEIFMLGMMIAGVVAFSVIAGALASVFSSMDAK